jgi:hypothetical protein
MTFRPLALVTAGLLTVLAGSAMAQSENLSATNQTTFRGSAPGACQLDVAASPSSANAQISALSPGSADIAISQMVGSDGLPLGATIVLVLPAVCNQAHTLNLSSLNGALLGDTPVTGGGAFRSQLPYSVTVSWAGGARSFQTGQSMAPFALGDAAAGPVTVTIQIPSGGAPLAAGAYSDELVLELGIAG